MTGRLPQSKPNPIRRQFWNTNVHKATVAGKILGVAYWHAQFGETLQGGGEPLEGVLIQHLVCPRKYSGTIKLHVWWMNTPSSGSLLPCNASHHWICQCLTPSVFFFATVALWTLVFPLCISMGVRPRGGGGHSQYILVGVCRSTSKKGGLRHGYNPKKGVLGVEKGGS